MTKPAMAIPVTRTGLDRSAPFGFTCKRCLQCCRNKKIQVNPYEIARLAHHLGISTTEFIERCTVENGSFLKCNEDGSCMFLGADGCAVHSDRPLVCRLYPLARHVNQKNEEWFSELKPEADCRGSYRTDDTIAGYLEGEGAPAFMRAANIYLNLLWEMMSELETRQDEPTDEPPDEEDITPENWLDMHAVVTGYCLRHRLEIPRSVNEQMRLHVEALQQWIKPTQKE